MSELLPYLIAIGASLAAAIFALLNKVQKLRSENSQLSARELMNKALSDKEIAHAEAKESEQDYINIRNRYLKQSDDGDGTEGEL